VSREHAAEHGEKAPVVTLMQDIIALPRTAISATNSCIDRLQPPSILLAAKAAVLGWPTMLRLAGSIYLFH